MSRTDAEVVALCKQALAVGVMIDPEDLLAWWKDTTTDELVVPEACDDHACDHYVYDPRREVFCQACGHHRDDHDAKAFYVQSYAYGGHNLGEPFETHFITPHRYTQQENP